MGDRMLSIARRYGVAVLIVALALHLMLAIPPVRNESPTALFFAAVMMSSWYGGLGASLLSEVPHERLETLPHGGAHPGDRPFRTGRPARRPALHLPWGCRRTSDFSQE